MIIHDNEFTDNDLYAWLDTVVKVKDDYDPQIHMTAEVYAKHKGRCVTWAQRKLMELVDEGKLKRVKIFYRETGKDGTGFIKVG